MTPVARLWTTPKLMCLLCSVVAQAGTKPISDHTANDPSNRYVNRYNITSQVIQIKPDDIYPNTLTQTFVVPENPFSQPQRNISCQNIEESYCLDIIDFLHVPGNQNNERTNFNETIKMLFSRRNGSNSSYALQKVFLSSNDSLEVPYNNIHKNDFRVKGKLKKPTKRDDVDNKTKTRSKRDNNLFETLQEVLEAAKYDEMNNDNSSEIVEEPETETAVLKTKTENKKSEENFLPDVLLHEIQNTSDVTNDTIDDEIDRLQDPEFVKEDDLEDKKHTFTTEKGFTDWFPPPGKTSYTGKKHDPNEVFHYIQRAIHYRYNVAVEVMHAGSIFLNKIIDALDI